MRRQVGVMIVFAGLSCLSIAVSGFERRDDHVINRRRRSPFSSSLDVDEVDNNNCTSACLNSLRSSTEADDAFRPHFVELSALSSVVPQVFISNVDLETFKNYCSSAYLPFRECLFSCSPNITADVLRNLTMLETMCVDYYREMTLHVPCMKEAYKTASNSCESTCFPTSILTSSGSPSTNELITTTLAAEPVDATDGADAAANSTTPPLAFIDTTADSNNSSPSTAAMTVVQRDDPPVYLKPNETIAFFCWLLKCVSLCDTVQVQTQCGYESANLEDVLVDAMARTTMLATQQADQQPNSWPGVCDKLMLRYHDNGQAGVRGTTLACWSSSAAMFFSSFLMLRRP